MTEAEATSIADEAGIEIVIGMRDDASVPCACQARSAPARPELKPGTRLVREWQGRTYEVLVLDDGFSWQGTQLPLAFRPREKDHRHSVVGTALLRVEAEPARRSPVLASVPSVGEPMESSNAAG